MDELPILIEDFLDVLNDYAVGGTMVSPGLATYHHKSRLRTALSTREDWANNEGVHINPSKDSRATALRGIGLKDDEKYYEDRVVLLDFDIYNKDGSLKAENPQTPQEVMNRLVTGGFPLPYYWLESGTPGNFHMVWVLKVPALREDARPWVKEAYHYWGADTRYTNSTMRNPVYLSLHEPDKVHWWPEWSAERPLLEDVSQLLPSDYEVPLDTPHYQRPADYRPTYKYRTRMSLSQLEGSMRGAHDTEGRWHLLDSWVRRHIMKHHQTTGRTLHPKKVAEVVAQGNALFAEPLEARRIDSLLNYWSMAKQRWYISRQKAAGDNNEQAKYTHADAVVRYYEMVDFKEDLEKFLRGDNHNLGPTTVDRDQQFTGRKASTKGQACYAYVAWMMGLSDSETVNLKTGEVTEVTGANQVKNLLANGKRAGYTREMLPDALRLLGLVDPEDDDEEIEAILNELTRGITSGRVVDLSKYVPSPTERGVYVHC